jgi:phosphatidylinositol phospholipase C delta
MDPLRFWRAGAHIAALNWQRYDAGMQLNEGLFVGSEGWVLKPAYLRGEGDAKSGRVKLAAEVVGISALPPPNGRADKSFSAYVNAELLHAQQDQKWHSKTVKTQDVPGAGADVMWNERFEWEYERDEMAFLKSVSLTSLFFFLSL